MNTRTFAPIASGLLAAAALFLSSLAPAQPTSTSPLANNPNGMRHADPTWVALTNAAVHTRPGETLSHATVIFKDGRITAVLTADPGPDGKPGTDDDIAPATPPGPRVYDCSNFHIYAAFIEPYLELDTPKPGASDPGKHWNDAVTPQRTALDGLANLESQANALRKLGFGAAAISPKGGIFRGRSAVVSLAKPESDANAAADRPPVYADNAYQSLSFDNDSGGYPDSQMGAIALIRQTFSDADWQFQGRRSGAFDEPTNCLDALARPTSKDPQPPIATNFVFDCSNELEVLRAFKIAKEFSREPVILGSGSEYKRLGAVYDAAQGMAFGRQMKPISSDEAIRMDDPTIASAAPFFLPLNFPPAPDVSTPGKAQQVDLRELMSWEQAPTNPRRVAAAGIKFALTTHRLKNKNEFAPNLRRAIAHGLTEDQALAALTTEPAQILGVSNQLGAIAPGLRANLLVTDGPVFAKKNEQGKPTKLRDLWIDGVRHELNPPPAPDLEGTWKLDVASSPAPHPSRKGPADGESGRGSDLPSQPRGTGVSPVPTPSTTSPLLLTISESNSLTLKLAKKSTKAERVSITQTSISFTFDLAALSDEKDAPSRIYTLSGLLDPDSSGTVTTFKGTALDDASRPTTFSATKQPKNPILGKWRVSETDGVAKDPASKNQLDLTITDDSLTLRFTFENKDPITIKADEFKLDGKTITFKQPLKEFNQEGSTTDTITLSEAPAPTGASQPTYVLEGSSTLPDNSVHTYKATRVEKPAKPDEDEDPTDPALITKDIPESLGLPFGPYALDHLPFQDSVALVNATIWPNTGEPFQGAVLIKLGKIAQVVKGKAELPSGYRVIDCTGKHITPGIIDCHSHTGISGGVNEAGRAVSAEVRIADVTNPDSIDWYRQLAGGVTTVNSLHGSANAIGGQVQTNKIRWGCAAPDDMHFEGAIGGIKFALGENPTQMNSSRRERNRYPNTRMGVETLIRDRFTQAKEYAEHWLPWENAADSVGASGIWTWMADKPGSRDIQERIEKNAKGLGVTSPLPRRDFQLEALAEVLRGERLIHCHSYRQDEILMLTQIARDFHFKIGTFQHILEGYKVAEFVRDYSGGASGFSDWWAYKIEVQDAIPGGPVLMHEVGVTVSYNSDSDELARRLNVEAAKAVKYSNGRITPTEALKFVTLNPAKQLRIDNRVGTIEVGKDADLAIWSGDPLSAFSKCERTFVDGRELFSLEQDAKHRETIAKERARIIQKILSQPKKPKGTAAGESRDKPESGVDSPRPRRRRPPNEDTSGAASASSSGSPSFQEGAGGKSPSPDASNPAPSELTIRRRLYYLYLLSQGIDPESHQPGDCGCDEVH